MDSVRAKHAAELEAKRKKLEEIRKRKAAVRAAEESSSAFESVSQVIGQQENKFDDFIQNILKTSGETEISKDDDKQDVQGGESHIVTNTLSLAEKLSSLSTVSNVAEMHIQPTLVETYTKHTETDITLEHEIIVKINGAMDLDVVIMEGQSQEHLENVDDSCTTGGSSPRSRNVMVESLEMGTTDNSSTVLSAEDRTNLLQSDAMETFLNKASRIMERALNTSSKFDILIDYGENVEQDKSVEEATESLKLQHVFVDDKWSKHRAVTDVDVSPFYPELTLVAYTARNFLEEKGQDMSSQWDTMGNSPKVALTEVAAITEGVVLLWSTALPGRPEYRFTCHSQVTSACFNPFDRHIIVGGTYSGQIVVWDTRAKSAPVQKTALSAFSHAHPIYAMAVAGTKNSYTLISASTDGRVCIWDLDHLQKPLDMLDLRILLSIVSNYTSVSASDKKMEASVTSFAVLGKEIKELFIGTEAGKLYSTKVDQQRKKPGAGDDSSGMDADKRNRNSQGSLGSSTGDLVREVIVEAVSKEGSHFGPVTAMHFNPLLPMHRNSLLLTCSLDSTVKLWSSDHPESPVLSFEPSSEYISDVRWSPVHPALFAVADSSGVVSIWNILKDTEVSVVSEKISEKSLNKVRWNADGKSVITGDVNGTSYIYGVPSAVALPQQDDLSLLESKVATSIAAAALSKP